jgi:hypothetical protein
VTIKFHYHLTITVLNKLAVMRLFSLNVFKKSKTSQNITLNFIVGE